MKAMILAAGYGHRMRPLTDHTPKPLLKVGDDALIEHIIKALVRGGFNELVINLHHLGTQIEEYLGNGANYGAQITYVREREVGLETGGGIFNALPHLGDAPFLVVNADIWTDYPFTNLSKLTSGLAHLVLIANPSHHPQGDFCLCADGSVTNEGEPRYTFAGIGVYHPRLFKDCVKGVFPLAPLLREAASLQQVTAEYYAGEWQDVGTPERLKSLNKA